VWHRTVTFVRRYRLSVYYISILATIAVVLEMAAR
jgi:hypothetical protein